MIDSPGRPVLELKGQHFRLLPEKAMIWEEENTLILADLHIGKVGHFRKAGIAIPKLLEQEDLATLSDLIAEHNPSQIYFLGDLFHSSMNDDWEWLRLWRQLHPGIPMTLVLGNHDILHEKHYQEANFTVVDELAAGPFTFTHEPECSEVRSETAPYNICGHIHPAVRLRGKGRQSLRLPCFIFGEYQAFLPAFGKFTGTFFMDYTETDRLFGVLKDKVVAL